MPPRYYSFRAGKRKGNVQLEFDLLKRLFAVTWEDFSAKGYFNEAFGFYCVDADYIPGSVGSDVSLYVFKKLRRPSLWPIKENLDNYEQDDVFDIIEFLYDHVSKPTKGTMHSWNSCGMHWSEFSSDEGREEFRSEVNAYLADFQGGFELSGQGEVVEKGDVGTEKLLEAMIPEGSPKTVRETVGEAVRLFRSRHSSKVDRRNAVRMLAGVLEHLRPKLKRVISSSDEGDLFNIANNFAIRHDNEIQKREYDPVWLTWMFYFYLATIHTVTRRIEAVCASTGHSRSQR